LIADMKSEAEFYSEKHDALVIRDGRQSQPAAAIQRGLCRMFKTLGFVTLCELPLKNARRADIISIGPSGDVWIADRKSVV